MKEKNLIDEINKLILNNPKDKSLTATKKLADIKLLINELEKNIGAKDKDKIKDNLADLLISLNVISSRFKLDTEEYALDKISKMNKKPKASSEKKEEKKDVKAKAKKENTIGFSAYDSTKNKDFFLEIVNKTLLKNDKNLLKKDKKGIISEIISYYDKMELLPLLLSEEELLFLKVNILKKVSNKIHAYKFLSDLMVFTNVENNIAVTGELYNTLSKSIQKYNDNKAEIEASKENGYLLVGIMRVFGALTQDEMNRILSKYAKEEIGSYESIPYALRHIEYKDEYGLSYFVLRNLGLDEVSLIETHRDNLKCSYSKKELIGIGKAYFNVYSSEYKYLAKNPKSIALLNKIDKEELIRASLKNEDLKSFTKEFKASSDLSEKDKLYAINFINSLPKLDVKI